MIHSVWKNLAYEFRNLSVRHLKKTGQPPLMIGLYEMASPEDAYGFCSFEHQHESTGIGHASEWVGGLLRLWKRKYSVSVYAEVDGSEVESAF